jgi:osmotically-inducible protein OsmY
MVSLSNQTVPLTDRDLEHHVTAGLLNRHVHALRQVGVQAKGGTITLRGTLTSFYQKQLCIQACRAVPGVVALVDELEVSPIMQ